MKSDVADVVFPFLDEVFSALLDKTPVRDASGFLPLRARLKEQLRKTGEVEVRWVSDEPRQMTNANPLEGPLYPLVSWADEMFTTSPTYNGAHWASQRLELLFSQYDPPGLGGNRAVNIPLLARSALVRDLDEPLEIHWLIHQVGFVWNSDPKQGQQWLAEAGSVVPTRVAADRPPAAKLPPRESHAWARLPWYTGDRFLTRIAMGAALAWAIASAACLVPGLLTR